MYRFRMRSGVALMVVACFLYATSLVQAASDSYTPRDKDDVSVEAVMIDGLLLRPAGIVAMIIGSATFVVTLPFSIPTKSVDRAAQKLVVDPAKYTFVRPLGQVDKPVR